MLKYDLILLMEDRDTQTVHLSIDWLEKYYWRDNVHGSSYLKSAFELSKEIENEKKV